MWVHGGGFGVSGAVGGVMSWFLHRLYHTVALTSSLFMDIYKRLSSENVKP